MFKASVTSKGQVTIPKEVRELLDIKTGDNIIFNVDDVNNNITVTKDVETITCPICLAIREIECQDEKEKYNCPVCQGTGQIRKNISILQEIGSLMSASLKYGMGISLITHTEDGKKLIPEVTLVSKLYPQKILNLIQDYYQVRLIEDFAPKALNDKSELKFMYPNNYALDEILDLLKTDKERERVKKWFRHDRTVYKSKDMD